MSTLSSAMSWGPAASRRESTTRRNAVHERLCANSRPSCAHRYLVRYVWELMRLKSDTHVSFVIWADTFRALAMRLDGLEIMPMGAESKLAQLALRDIAASDPAPTRMRLVGAEPSLGDSKWSWRRKLLALPVPVTCNSVNRACPVSSRGVICSPEKLSPSSPCTCMSNMGVLGVCRSVPCTCTMGGGHKNRFSEP